MKRFLGVVLSMGLMLAPFGVWGQTWVDYATVSMTNATTPKLVNKNVCYTDGTDIACDGAAGLLTTSGTLVITNISATNLTVGGVPVSAGSSGDRIVSGTNSIVAQTASNIISITTNGVNTGYFNTNGVLTLPGISATANLTSVTSLYASGKMGLGVAPGTAKLTMQPIDYTAGVDGIKFQSGDNSVHSIIQPIKVTGANMNLLLGANSYNGTFGGLARFDNSTASAAINIRSDNGKIEFYTGDATVTPTTKMAIDSTGNISATGPIKFGGSTLSCTSTISGTIRFNPTSNTMEYCNSSAWSSLSTSATSPVSFNVNKGGTNQTVATNTFVKLTWSTKVFDTNNNFASDKFTPTVPGKYLFHVGVYCIDNTSGSPCSPMIYKNGALVLQGGGDSASGPINSVMEILDMNGTTDYVEAYVYNGGGTLISGNTIHTVFDGVLLSPQGGGAGGTATPAGSTGDVQYASGGALAADTGNFTYSSGILKAPNISTTNITLTTINGVPYTGGASGDRIVSGTNSIVAQTASNIISITTNGVNTGYFNTNGVLTLPGISATANLTSVTSLYASGLLTVANAANPAIFVSDTGSTGGKLYLGVATGAGNYSDIAVAGDAVIRTGSNASGLGTNLILSARTVTGSVIFTTGIADTEKMRINSGGSVSLTGPIKVGTSSLTCSSAISGTIRYNTASSTLEYCNSTNWVSTISGTVVAFLVNKNNAAQTIPTNTTTLITWPNKVFDTNNNFNTATGRFTPTIPGKYILNFEAYCSDATGYCGLRITKNGVQIAARQSPNDGVSVQNLTTIIDMNGTTDYIETLVYNGGGTQVDGNTQLTMFSGALLAPQSGGSGGTANPAGSSNDVQYNSGGALAADTGNFTYSGGILKVPNISTTNITLTTINGVAYTGGASGDRITSGTAGVIANTTGGYISLTTGATTWGYLGSSATYLPLISGNTASYTTLLGTLATAAQPNITSLGTLTSLNATTGNISTIIASSVSSSSGLFTNLGSTGTSTLGTVTANTVSVTGAIKVGSSSLACSSAVSGTIRYNTASSTLEYCNSTNWVSTISGSVVAFSVTKSTQQTITAGTYTKMTWSTEEFDTNNNFASDRFTPTIPGKYLIVLNVSCRNGSDSYCYAAVYKNGSAHKMTYNNMGTHASDQMVFLSDIVDMNGTTDYLEAYGRDDVGTALGTTSYFQGSLLAPQGGGAGGTANPAGSTGDIQYASGGALAADTGNFTYASGILKAPNISTTNISLSTINGVAYTGGASGDRITSGTAGVIANTTGGYISLTTGATTWGYLGSSATFLPTVNGNQVSATNVSLTSSGYSGQTVTNIAGGGGNYIVSATTSVSASNAGSGSIKFATASGLVMTVSGSYVGIGTSTPSRPVHLKDASGSGFMLEMTHSSTNADRILTVANASGTIGVWDGAGNVGIGTSNPGGRLEVSGMTYLNTHAAKSVTAGLYLGYTGGGTQYGIEFQPGADNAAALWFLNAAGTNVGAITNSSGATTYTTTSDRRLKENIVATTEGLASLEKIEVKDFNFISDPSKTRVQGFIAQDLYKVYPAAVIVGTDDVKKHPWSVDYGRITPLIVKATQELKELVDNDHEEISQLKAQNESLQRQINELKASRK